MNPNTVYAEHYPLEVRAAVYCRLSKDDGYTGLNMERPGPPCLLAGVEGGRFDVILTKDLSRLGRNYLQTGQLLEEFFPRNHVRYIALNDAVDTDIENDITPFRNILNEMYSRDVSKKVHSSYLTKPKSGKFTGCLAPFGYRKDPEDKNHLLPDEETAWIVRKIYDYARNGHGPNYIRRRRWFTASRWAGCPIRNGRTGLPSRVCTSRLLIGKPMTLFSRKSRTGKGRTHGAISACLPGLSNADNAAAPSISAPPTPRVRKKSSPVPSTTSTAWPIVPSTESAMTRFTVSFSNRYGNVPEPPLRTSRTQPTSSKKAAGPRKNPNAPQSCKASRRTRNGSPRWNVS